MPTEVKPVLTEQEKKQARLEILELLAYKKSAPPTAPTSTKPSPVALRRIPSAIQVPVESKLLAAPRVPLLAVFKIKKIKTSLNPQPARYHHRPRRRASKEPRFKVTTWLKPIIIKQKKSFRPQRLSDKSFSTAILLFWRRLRHSSWAYGFTNTPTSSFFASLKTVKLHYEKIYQTVSKRLKQWEKKLQTWEHQLEKWVHRTWLGCLLSLTTSVAIALVYALILAFKV